MNKDMRDANDAADLIQRIYFYGDDGVHMNTSECLLMTRLLSDRAFYDRAMEAWDNRFGTEN